MNIQILQESFILLTTNKYIFTAYIEKVLRYTHNVLVKSEYIEYEYEYEYMTHKLYKYEYEYLKNVLEYTSTEYFHPRSARENITKKH